MTFPIEYITLTSDIMTRKDLTLAERVVAGLVKSFSARGVMMSNAAIGKFFLLSPKHISKILNQLERKRFITIENPKGKCRRVYLRTEADVQGSQPLPVEGSTSLQPPPAGGITSACKRNINKENKNNINIISSQEVQRFVKPTPDQVQAYARSIGYTLDSQSFCDYYESKGWMIGKSKMCNWQAAVRTWQRNQNTFGKKDKLPRITQEVTNNGQYKTITA